MLLFPLTTPILPSTRKHQGPVQIMFELGSSTYGCVSFPPSILRQGKNHSVGSLLKVRQEGTFLNCFWKRRCSMGANNVSLTILCGNVPIIMSLSEAFTAHTDMLCGEGIICSAYSIQAPPFQVQNLYVASSIRPHNKVSGGKQKCTLRNVFNPQRTKATYCLSDGTTWVTDTVKRPIGSVPGYGAPLFEILIRVLRPSLG